MITASWFEAIAVSWGSPDVLTLGGPLLRWGMAICPTSIFPMLYSRGCMADCQLWGIAYEGFGTGRGISPNGIDQGIEGQVSTAKHLRTHVIDLDLTW